MRPLYIVGTERNVGKTTLCIGLISALRRRGLSVGYTKPLGQRISSVAGQPVHDDALVVSRAMGLEARESASMAVPLTRGRVEKEIFDLQFPRLAEKVVGVCGRLSGANDAVIVEGMGHVAMGSCLKLSAADIARIIGARAILVSGGGIGRAIDQIALCATFLEARLVPLIGAVVNQVWPEKYDRVRDATVKGLATLGIRSLGTVPFDDVLASPTVGQVCEELGAEVLCGAGALDRRIGNTIVGAMESHHMVRYVKDRALVITPGDRSDNILAVLSVHMLDPGPPPPVAGLALTGGFQPDEKVMSLLVESGLPAMLHKDDTYTLAARLRGTVFKITPNDTERIAAAMRIVERHLDVDTILEGIKA